MRVAAITPYCVETLDVLRQCHDSVIQQTYPCTHFMVSDGPSNPEVATWQVEHLTLSKRHDDNGNTPRAIGALSAMNQGFDAICLLDADNWFHLDHVQAMVDLHRRTNAALCIASRNLHALDGTFLSFDDYDSDAKAHVDTSCLFYTRAAFRLLPMWAMLPTQLGPIGDRFIWKAIQARRTSIAVNPQPTVAFRSQYTNHYWHVGVQPPPNMKTSATTRVAWDWWRSLSEEVRRDWEVYFNGA